MYDIIVVGGGPAGMTAALYGLRNGKSVLVIEKAGFGGQITHSPKVENYPGTMQMSGNEFADRFLEQILAQGADVELETVVSVEENNGYKTVKTEEGGSYDSHTVILATGVKHRMLGLEKEETFVGEGISFCAVCDGDFYTNKTVCVAGGGNSALQEAILLSGKCKNVIILQDLPMLTGEKRLQDVLKNRANVSVITNQRIVGILSEDETFQGVRVENRETGEQQEITCDGMFVAIGLVPQNEPFSALAKLNQWGYFDSGEQCTTCTPGIYVAGDCRSKTVRQLTTAVADGATAALAACKYIDEGRSSL